MLIRFPALLSLLLQFRFSFGLTPFPDAAFTKAINYTQEKAGDAVGITLLQDARQSGAVCLDGSAPAYHLRPGFGSGAKNWHIRLEGGGWCESSSACATRAKTSHGSSKLMSNQILFNGILSNKYSVNPDFYNWNHVYVRYCDGGSFSADVAVPVRHWSGQALYFRGLRIFRAVVKHLQTKGLSTAKQALLSGCSAGGLGVVHRCNEFKYLLPNANVKCLSDAGYFVNGQSIRGNFAMYNYYKGVVNLQKLQNTLARACTSAKDPVQCFFPQQAQGYIRQPTFFVNAAYDNWQLENVKEISWRQYSPCMRFASCFHAKTLQAFRQNLLNGLFYAQSRAGWGTFIDSCFSHCQLEVDIKWTRPRIHGKSLAKAVGDWYFGRSQSTHYIDCGFPTCNPTCVKYPLMSTST
ncbi:pectin acetylesterase 7 [Selaginella moellendorffii]|uniref:pectin acetylesterase 7 n=1 Tax=Selaginella moellendorffii TaxID=88036 RepID=UPI000D1C4B3C|nr:pectin acetylesterase 7 [Selaginella moellendorffii]|eukprot:XP_024519433.1 pectin acetylesterase 7 [Selaginella moellendorffii]